jgi:hypothetical protein
MPGVKQMIFRATTPEGEPLVTQASEGLTAFLSMTKDLGLSFLDDLAITEGWDMSIDYRTMKELRALNILVRRNDVSENYSVFLCGQNTQTTRLSAFEIEVSKEIKSRREAIAKENLKVRYYVPIDCDMLLIQLKNFRGMTVFLFSDKTPLLRCIDPWIELWERQRQALRERIEREPTICAQILTIIDTSVQEFLRSCRMAPSMDKYIYDCLSPHDSINQVLRNHTMTIMLPSKIAPLLEQQLAKPAATKSLTFEIQKTSSMFLQADASTKEYNVKSSSQSNNRSGEDNSRKRKQNGDFSKSVKNEECNLALKDKYKGNAALCYDKMNEMPKVNNTQLCCKFHLEGECPYGKSCKRAKSHVSISKR